MKTEELLAGIAEALGVEGRDLALNDTPETIEEWDSIGHLTILSYLEEELGVDVNSDKVQQFRSIEELVSVLREHGLVENP